MKIAKTVHPPKRFEHINDWYRYVYYHANQGKGLTPERLGKNVQP